MCIKAMPGLCGTPVPVPFWGLSIVPSRSHKQDWKFQIPGPVPIHGTNAANFLYLVYFEGPLENYRDLT